jgi:hypothetical protein
MVGKIPAMGIGKWPKKILVWWEISLGLERKFLPVHPLYRPGFPFPFCISVICHAVRISARCNLISYLPRIEYP